LRIFPDLFIDQIFDFPDFLGSQGLVMAEIKTEPLRIDNRAALFNMLPKDFTQGPMKQVSCGMVVGNPLPTRGVYLCGDCFPYMKRALCCFPYMGYHPFVRGLAISYFK